MKVYCFGEKEKPVIFLFPGTCCHWKGNFGKVIEPLEEYFRVACVSYDGFDETEQTEFPTMTEETEKIEQYIISVPHMAVHWAVLLTDCLQHAEISTWSMVF